jgi:hypothetical protein
MAIEITTADATTLAGIREALEIGDRDEPNGFAGVESDGTINAIVGHRIGTASELGSLVLLEGELAVETHPSDDYPVNIRVGDGSTLGGVVVNEKIIKVLNTTVTRTAAGINSTAPLVPELELALNTGTYDVEASLQFFSGSALTGNISYGLICTTANFIGTWSPFRWLLVEGTMSIPHSNWNSGNTTRAITVAPNQRVFLFSKIRMELSSPGLVQVRFAPAVELVDGVQLVMGSRIEASRVMPSLPFSPEPE